MKILHIHASMQGGGIEAMVCALANEMSGLGHDVTVCSIYKPRETDIFWHKLSPSVKKETIGKVASQNPVITEFNVWKYIKKGDFDIVQMHGFFYYYFPSIFLNRKPKYCYTIHNDAVKENVVFDAKLVPLKKIAFKRRLCNAITISPESQMSFQAFYNSYNKLIVNGTPRPKVDVSFNLKKELNIPLDSQLFINPARITEQKNQIMLVKCFKRLIREGYDVALVVAGAIQDSSIYNEIKRDLCDRIFYIGEVSDVPSKMNGCDGMCLSSTWEGLPVTLLEALAVGCIPICTPVGGITSVIKNGENGILSKSSCEEDYYKALLSFMKMKSEQKGILKKNCVKSFEYYDINRAANDYLNFYKTLI